MKLRIWGKKGYSSSIIVNELDVIRESYGLMIFLWFKWFKISNSLVIHFLKSPVPCITLAAKFLPNHKIWNLIEFYSWPMCTIRFKCTNQYFFQQRGTRCLGFLYRVHLPNRKYRRISYFWSWHLLFYPQRWYRNRFLRRVNTPTLKSIRQYF